MSGNRIRADYFTWMYNMVCTVTEMTYYDLFGYLNSVEFVPLLSMDANRADDGLGLRYKFGRERGISREDIADAFYGVPCSVLEMMVALANRCEETIMKNPEYGDRTSVWFWTMINTLGLSDMYDGNFQALKASHIMYIFMNRLYDKDGSGGLFKIDSNTKDMRETEIWYQMYYYLDELLNL